MFIKASIGEKWQEPNNCEDRYAMAKFNKLHFRRMHLHVTGEIGEYFLLVKITNYTKHDRQ